MKRCPKCGLDLPATSFYRHGRYLGNYCKPCSLVVRRLWLAKHPEKASRYKQSERERLRSKIFEVLGAICKACGFADIRALQVDHIEGGGNEEKRKLGRANGYLRHILKNPQKYQILCANCNTIKARELKQFGTPKYTNIS